MRGARVAIIAALLAFAGCKNTDKSGDDKSPGGVASRNKKDGKDATPTKGPSWLDDVGRLPGAGTSIPKGTGPSDPKNPNFDPKLARQDALGGQVVDTENKPARNILVRIEQVGAASARLPPIGISTKDDGSFFASGFKTGQAYELTVQATTTDGRKLVGSAQTKVPNPVLRIVLRDDTPPQIKVTDGGVFPPDPKTSDKVGDYIPPNVMPKPTDGGWGPGGPGGSTGVPPTTIGGSTTPKPPAPGNIIPQPADLAPQPTPKPENTAIGGPKEPFKPPAANIPPPGPPPVPKLPPPPPPGGQSMGDMGKTGNTGNAVGKFTLVDTLERPWSLDDVKPGSLVLVEFITSDSGPCKQAIPIMTDLQSRYGASGLQVAAVLCDDTPTKERIATAAKYRSDANLNYVVYVESGNSGSIWARADFKVQRCPHAVLVDSTGRVLWSGHAGSKNEIETAIKQGLAK
jgi:thiol-disulfide isomerase/thioredoxin